MFRLILLLATASLSFAQLRISQVYGGGGNAGATFKNDFIEVFNAGSSPATAAITNTTAAVRNGAGCTDTNNNNLDFTVSGGPNPRNTASTVNACSATTSPSGSGAASPNPVGAGNNTLITVNVTPGTGPT